jgi:dienelactone hydrolase
MKLPSGIEGMSARTGCRFSAALLLAWAVGCAQAKVVEEQFQLPVQVSDSYGKPIEQNITVTVFDDDEIAGPKPVLIIDHGRAGEASERAAMGRARYPVASRWLAREGFIVALPTRIGYGVSGGPDVEDGGSCARRNYPPGFLAAAAQAIATLNAVRERPDALKDRSVIIGQSYGGATSVAIASLNPPGVVASINFAGGAGGNPKSHAQDPCSPQSLQRMYVLFGQTARVPMLWAYTENDQYWGPKLPREWFEAYVAAGGKAEFVQFTPHGDDGHLLFARFFDVWRPTVTQFLRKQGFDMKDLP